MPGQYPKSDQWGRPKIVPAAGGSAKGHTRVTTIAKTLDDMNGLLDWKAAMTAGGAVLRPDILAQIGARWPRTDENKGELRKLTEALEEAAAASEGRNRGDALHEYIRSINLGRPFTAMTEVEPDLIAYQKLLADYELVPDPAYVEKTVVVPALTVAGSFDFGARKRGEGPLIICDLKSAVKGLDYSWPSISMQMALYSRAETVYDWDSETHTPMPEVNQDIGLVVWLPAGQGHAELHVIDLNAGWQAVQQALWVRDWRKRKDLARPAQVK